MGAFRFEAGQRAAMLVGQSAVGVEPVQQPPALGGCYLGRERVDHVSAGSSPAAACSNALAGPALARANLRRSGLVR